jgi:hypothetical protein
MASSMSELRTNLQKFLLLCRRAYKPDWKWHNFRDKPAHDKFIDKRVNNYAQTIREFYHGYPYVIKCSTSSEIYKMFSNYSRIGHDMDQFTSILENWLAENCIGERRHDYHRTMLHQGEECMDELGGGDHLFMAFMEEQDAIMFSLRWA